jgi:thiamine biosynthesis protein ThiI
MDIEREIGLSCCKKFQDKSVNLSQPDRTIFIELVEKWAFVGREKISGSGGLPTGSSGKILALLSGGIDSPVASYQMLRRGCEVDFIHFHSYPYVDEASVSKVKDLAFHLSHWQKTTKLYLIPFLEVQKKIVMETRADYRIILYRRYMFRTAQCLAKKIKAQALVTGESLGQVASQTLENISLIQQVVSLPIFRPLIGYDKNKIITQAKQIKTYELSILPHQDCSSLFVPEHPVTKAQYFLVENEEIKLPQENLINDMLNRLEYVCFR